MPASSHEPSRVRQRGRDVDVAPGERDESDDEDSREDADDELQSGHESVAEDGDDDRDDEAAAHADEDEQLMRQRTVELGADENGCRCLAEDPEQGTAPEDAR